MEDDDTAALDKAGRHYENALKAVINYKNQEIKPNDTPENKQRNIERRKAAIWTNLGYVKGLQKEYAAAYDNLNNAINIWNNLEDPRETARAETAKAILERDQGNLDLAIALFREARDRVYFPEDQQQLCRVTFHLSWAEWFKAEEVGIFNYEGLKMLEKAHEHLIESRGYVDEFNYSRETPGVYHQLASVKWHLGQAYKLRSDDVKAKEFSDDARALNRKAIEFCLKFRNNRYWIDARVGDAEFDLDDGNGTNMPTYRSEIYKFEADHPNLFKLFYGRFRKIEGDFAFLEGRHDQAFDFYGAAMELIISSNPLSGPYSLEHELKHLRNQLEKIDEMQAIKYCNELHARWEHLKQDPQDRLSKWAQETKNHLELR